MSFGIIVRGVILSLMFTCCFIPFGILFIVLYYWLSDKIMTFIFKNNPELCKNIYIMLKYKKCFQKVKEEVKT